MGLRVGSVACPLCGSRSGGSLYDDGGGYCHACNKPFDPATGEGLVSQHPPESGANRGWVPIDGYYQALPKRGLDEDDLRHWGYQMGELRDGTPVHIMNVRDQTGKPVAQKYRTRDKEFTWASDTKQHPLYGAWLWPSKGRSVVVTEGELDAISVSKAFGHRYPVVSLPDGTGSVKKTLKASYDWLDGFAEIVLCFDQDEPGQRATAEAIDLLPPGKVYIMRLPEGCKDANECLIQHGASVLSKCYWNKTLWKPDGIISGEDMSLEDIMQETPAGVPLPYPKLQEMIYGFRPELTLLTAGSGIGKSTLAREWAYWLKVHHGCKIGNIFLEEKNRKTAQAYVAIDRNIPLGRLRFEPTLLTREEWAESKAKAVNGGMWFYNHFGSLESKGLISKIAYLRRACGVDFVMLDHISIVTSGMESSSEGERKDIDVLMTNLQTVIQQTDVGIIAIVHLKRKPGANFNEGDAISLSDLRGSGALEQLSDNVIALERDQQAAGEKACVERVRVLKCRETGYTGLADTLRYDRPTGRLVLANSFTAATPPSQDDDEEEHKF